MFGFIAMVQVEPCYCKGLRSDGQIGRKAVLSTNRFGCVVVSDVDS